MFELENDRQLMIRLCLTLTLCISVIGCPIVQLGLSLICWACYWDHTSREKEPRALRLCTTSIFVLEGEGSETMIRPTNWLGTIWTRGETRVRVLDTELSNHVLGTNFQSKCNWDFLSVDPSQVRFGWVRFHLTCIPTFKILCQFLEILIYQIYFTCKRRIIFIPWESYVKTCISISFVRLLFWEKKNIIWFSSR